MIISWLFEMQCFIKDSFSKCDQICKKLRICSHLLKKSLLENLILFTAISQRHKTWAKYMPSKWYLKGQGLDLSFLLVFNPATNTYVDSQHSTTFSSLVIQNLLISTKIVFFPTSLISFVLLCFVFPGLFIDENTWK